MKIASKLKWTLPLIVAGTMLVSTQPKKAPADPVLTTHSEQIPEGDELVHRETLRLDEIAEELVDAGYRKSQVDSLLSDYSIRYDSLVAQRYIPRKASSSSQTRRTPYTKRLRNYWMHENVQFIRDRLVDKASELAAYAIEAEKKYGVDRRYLVAIFGHETQFGEVHWQHRLLDGLVTQYNVGVEYNSNYRKRFALENLKGVLDFANKNTLSVKNLNNLWISYAGGMSFAQVMGFNLHRTEYTSFEEMYSDERKTILTIARFLSGADTNGRKWNPNLNGKTIGWRRGNGEMIRRYNPSRIYVDINVLFAEQIEIVNDSTAVQKELPAFVPYKFSLDMR